MRIAIWLAYLAIISIYMGTTALLIMQAIKYSYLNRWIILISVAFVGLSLLLITFATFVIISI